MIRKLYDLLTLRNDVLLAELQQLYMERALQTIERVLNLQCVVLDEHRRS